MMNEPFDEYVDGFTLGAGPYGAALNFQRTNPRPIAPGSTPIVEEIGSVRLSLEHLKMMAYVMKRQVDDVEKQLGIEIPLSFQLLNALKIPPEDWQNFWQRKG
jgi:hypothetical protein